LTQIIANRYEVIHLLGSGGMADVYLAEDKVLGRQVAVKILLSRLGLNPEFLERFHREARAAAGLSHQNIVAVYDQGECSDGHYIVMEYLRGRTLDQVIKAEGLFSSQRAVETALQVLSALAFAHKHSIIHRDIKPQNIVLDENGQVKVTDFGIARAADASEKLTQDGSILGTAHYLSPEQARGQEVVKGSDLYSVGVVLFEMLIGRVPFEGDNLMAVIHRHLTEQPPGLRDLNPNIPINLSITVGNALIKEAEFRYASAGEFAKDLNRCLNGLEVASRETVSSIDATQVVAPLVNSPAIAPPVTMVVSILECHQCGESNPAGSKYCRGCGKGIAEPVIKDVKKTALIRTALPYFSVAIVVALIVASFVVRSDNSPASAPTGLSSQTTKTNYAPGAFQTVGTRVDGLQIEDIRWWDHGSYFRIVFEMKDPQNRTPSVAPYTETLLETDGRIIDVTIKGVRSLSDKPNVKTVNLEVGNPLVTSIVRDTSVRDDQAFSYKIALPAQAKYSLSEESSPGRIIIDISKKT